ncbi:hypothetical protein CBR_g3999 [Chara braunii]|uniref:Uncharacterized protein n=1 Tax=Chara braunii TaxID=69332 RepID=A0A388KGV9_CHABU|nr:hypothetical protein CBR_g3999 [Chara braunii]|eukprot:GBG69300.1 hypothetical protein CBR_g3999 [Chara braunii]
MGDKGDTDDWVEGGLDDGEDNSGEDNCGNNTNNIKNNNNNNNINNFGINDTNKDNNNNNTNNNDGGSDDHDNDGANNNNNNNNTGCDDHGSGRVESDIRASEFIISGMGEMLQAAVGGTGVVLGSSRVESGASLIIISMMGEIPQEDAVGIGDDHNNNNDEGSNNDDGGSDYQGSSGAESISRKGERLHADVVGMGVDTDKKLTIFPPFPPFQPRCLVEDTSRIIDADWCCPALNIKQQWGADCPIEGRWVA